MWWTYWIITWVLFPHRKLIKQITWEIQKKRYNCCLPKRLQSNGGWRGLVWLIKQHMQWMSTVTVQERDEQCEHQQLRVNSMRSGRRGTGLVGDYAFLRQQWGAETAREQPLDEYRIKIWTCCKQKTLVNFKYRTEWCQKQCEPNTYLILSRFLF